MHRINFILGVALLVIAATLAVAISLRNPADDQSISSVDRTTRTESGFPQTPPGDSETTSLPGSPGTPQRNRVTRESRAEVFQVSVPENHPRQAQLARRAKEVEAEAKFQLERFTRQLQLTFQQERRLFPILVRSSEKYDPAMMISGNPSGVPSLAGAAANREFNEVLGPPQRDQVIEDAIADQVIWQDIISKLRRRLDEQTPQIPEGGSHNPATDPQVPRGRGNLFDTIEPPE